MFKEMSGVTPIPVTPSDSSPASVTSGQIVRPTANGYLFAHDNSETVLWTNPDTTANFDAQDVTLSQDYTNFKRIRIYFVPRTTVQTPVMSVDYSVSDIVANWQIGNSSVGSNEYKQRGTLTLMQGSNAYNRYILRGTDGSQTKIYIIRAYRHSDASSSSGIAIPTKITGLMI